ncbi:MAG: hypothetical protein K9H25_22725 [Rhodospirillum sp.]|nr:hypothetical protein [Rhodospirillum sp.]MCF8502548.1 hypothetical protein [Rhodospirillum sp.]
MESDKWIRATYALSSEKVIIEALRQIEAEEWVKKAALRHMRSTLESCPAGKIGQDGARKLFSFLDDFTITCQWNFLQWTLFRERDPMPDIIAHHGNLLSPVFLKGQQAGPA